MRDARLRMVLIGAMFMFLIFQGIPGKSEARVDINIGISPPPLVISGPPEVAIIPGTYVYFVPDVSADLFFYGGYWYRPHERRWFRASSYDGRWVYIERASVPEVLLRLPPDYRAMTGYRRIPYPGLSHFQATFDNEFIT